jgi:general secretion pathway protein N
MKKWFAIGAIFISVYLAFVIIAVPASFVVSYLKLPNNIVLNGVKGTIWRMTVDEVVHPKVTLDNIDASLNVLSFLSLDPSIDLEFGSDFSRGPRGKLSVAGLLANMTISDAAVVISADTIAQQLTLPVPLVASGDVNIFIETFIVGEPVCTNIQGKITWKKPSLSAFNETVQLGNLAAELSCKQGALAITIDDKNDLGLSFVTYVRPKKVSGNGHLTPAKNFPDNLKAVLPFLGKPNKQGSYRLFF